MMTDEKWLPVPDTGGRYEVSDLGRVRSVRRARAKGGLLTGSTSSPPYRTVAIDDRTLRVHRLVLLAFVGPPEPGQVTRHLNGDPLDNRLANLAYGTAAENLRDAVAHGTHYQASKAFCSKGHPLSGDNVRPVRHPSGWGRSCRTCRRNAQRAYRTKKASAQA